MIQHARDFGNCKLMLRLFDISTEGKATIFVARHGIGDGGDNVF
jgi:hypothetical protein